MIRMSVPLIDATSTAVIYRLDIQATAAVDPPGAETSGLDPIFGEPRVSYDGGYRRGSLRQEMSPAVRVPCQVEVKTAHQLSMTFSGNDAICEMTFVLHRKTLAGLGLLDSGGVCVIKPMDRIDRVEGHAGATVYTPNRPLFVYKVLPRSWGFGATGYDLEIVYTTHEQLDPQRG